MLNIFLVLSSLMFAFFGFWWSSASALNATIKLTLWILSFFGLFLLLQGLGYIIKI